MRAGSKAFLHNWNFIFLLFWPEPPPEREIFPISPNISSFYLVGKIMWGATFQSLDAAFQHTRFRATSENLKRRAAFTYRGRRDSGSELISNAGGDQRPRVLYVSFHELNFTDFLAVIPDLRQ